MLTRRRLILGGTAAIALAGAGATAFGYRRSLVELRNRVSARHSKLVRTRHGMAEYAEAGAGPPVLFIHGTGGGFDQGLHFAARLPGLGYRIIAPSRFGYLRSDFPADPGPMAQAEAFADLLDHLGIERAAVAGGSAGAIPAIAFALRFPDRTAALLPIVPAAYVPGRPLPEPWSPFQRRVTEAALGSDFIFWSAITLLPETMMGAVLATDPVLVAAAAPDEQKRARDILRFILPVSARRRGLMNDFAETGRPTALDYAAIRAPTLTISAEDDGFGTAENARHIASQVPGARSMIFPTGGHIWVGHDGEMFAAIDAFLRETGFG